MALPDRMQMALDKLAMGGYSAPQQQPALSAEFGGKKWEYATPQQVAAAHPAQDVTARPGVVSTAQGGFAEGGTLYGPMLKKPATVETAQTQPATSQPAAPQNPFTAMMPGAGRVRAFDDYISNLPPVQRKAAVAAIQNNPGMADVMQGSKFVRQYGIAQLTGIEPGDPKALEEQRRKDFHIWQTGYDANVAKLKEQGKLDDARKLTLQKIAQFNPDTVGITDPRQLGIIRQLKEAATNPVPSLDPDTAWKQIDEIVQRHVTGDMTEREQAQLTDERARRSEERADEQRQQDLAQKQQDKQLAAREEQLKLQATSAQKKLDAANKTMKDLLARWEKANSNGSEASLVRREGLQKEIDKLNEGLPALESAHDTAIQNLEKFYGEAAKGGSKSSLATPAEQPKPSLNPLSYQGPYTPPPAMPLAAPLSGAPGAARSVPNAYAGGRMPLPTEPTPSLPNKTWQNANTTVSNGAFLGTPAAQPQQTASAEPTATNPKTGQKIVYRNGQWVPA